VQFLANRGYAVLQPNYRGSGGYGEAFEELGKGQIGRAMQDDIDDAMDWAVAEGIADAKRVCVVGSSYGGYAALWAAIRNPERYRCAASFAGVTDWKKQLAYDRSFLSRKGARKHKERVRGADEEFDLDLVAPAVQAARLTRPVLLAHGEEDSNVPFKQYKLMRDAAAKAGKPIELLPFAEEGHGFDKPENQAKWLDTLETFLGKHNPPD
jgi:dipeptidyl aminopeptidase/acylaminoacyl peptidase